MSFNLHLKTPFKYSIEFRLVYNAILFHIKNAQLNNYTKYDVKITLRYCHEMRVTVSTQTAQQSKK